MRTPVIAPAALGALCLAATLGLSSCSRTPDAVLWRGSVPAAEVAGLSVRGGGPLRLSGLRGRTVLLAFGYTSCTEVCPLTMKSLARVLDALGPEAAQVRPLYVSVDPERDTPARFKTYLDGVDHRIEGLYVERGALEQALTAFSVTAERQPPPVRSYVGGRPVTDDDYAIDHTTTLFVVDARGQPRLKFGFKAAPADIAEGIRTLLREAAP